MQPSAVAASHLIRHNLRDFIRRSFAGGKTAWAPEQAPIRWPTCFLCRFVEDDDDDEENYLQKTLLQRGGQSQLGVDMATPSLSVLVMSSEILHALDGGRTVEGERDRGGNSGRRRMEAGRLAGRRQVGPLPSAKSPNAALSRFWDKLILWRLLSSVCGVCVLCVCDVCLLPVGQLMYFVCNWCRHLDFCTGHNDKLHVRCGVCAMCEINYTQRSTKVLDCPSFLSISHSLSRLSIW